MSEIVIKRRLIIKSTIASPLLLYSSNSFPFFWFLPITRGLISTIRVAGMISRTPKYRNLKLPSSRVYAHIPTRLSNELSRIEKIKLEKKLRKKEKIELKKSLHIEKNDFRYISDSDIRKLLRNIEEMYDLIDKLSDVSDLLEFIQKFDNPYDAIFTASREFLDSNTNLKRQFDFITKGVDIEFAKLKFDEEIERKMLIARRIPIY